MMKWGRRKAKPPSSSPSRNSSNSHVFPMSWLSKFKPKGSKNSEPKPTKEKPKAKLNTAANWRDGRFYGRDDESYWRLSFGEERFDGEKKSKGGLQSVWHNSEDELEFASSSCPNCGEGQDMWKFNDMVSDIRKTRDLPEIVEVEREETCKHFKDRRSRKTNPRLVDEKREGSERRSVQAQKMGILPEERDIFELEPMTVNQKVLSLNTNIPTVKPIGADCGSEALNLEKNGEEMTSEWGRLKEKKVQEFLLKNEKQRNSVYTSRKGKVRVHSPRTVARIECKIKAIEDLKRAKTKNKKKTKAVESRANGGFDSFAVVKSSVDPQGDFRNSMIEMIMEKEIRRSEELEELLACYLTLNADEYHDVIIKVFRQVWFELNQEYFTPVCIMENE